MKNDAEILRTVAEIKEVSKRYLNTVYAMNPCAATDRDVEEIIALADRLRSLYQEQD